MTTANKLEALFALFDEDGSGYIELDECKAVLMRSGPGMSPFTGDDADSFLAEFDTSGDGKISLEEFCASLGGSAESTVGDLLEGFSVKITVMSLTGGEDVHLLTANDTVTTLVESINDRTGIPPNQIRLFCEVPVGLDDSFSGNHISYAALPGYKPDGEWPEAIKRRPLVLLHSSASIASLMNVGLTSEKRANACSRIVAEGLVCWQLLSLRPMRPRDIPEDEKIGRSSTKRLQAELRNFTTVDSERISAAPMSEDNLGRWNVTIKPPPSTPYANGTFSATLVFPGKYPFEPPLFRFTTKIYHVNVDEDGVVYLPLLLGTTDEGGEWSPGHKASTVIDAVYGMMSTPVPECMARPEVAEQLKGDRSAHDATAAEWTDKFAA